MSLRVRRRPHYRHKELDHIMNSASAPRGFAAPAPYHVIRNFLGPELVAQLLAHTQANQHAFEPTSIGNGRIEPEIRVSLMLREFGSLRDMLADRFRAVRAEAVAALRLSSFELAHLEIELAAHGDGAFYSRHIDTRTSAVDRKTDRVLTGVYYFHTEPKHYSGGALRLHSILPPEQGGRFVDIAPEQDMYLLFPSWAPHEVRPVVCPSGAFMNHRFAINCWYRSHSSS
jgi:SM-20-related protein